MLRYFLLIYIQVGNSNTSQTDSYLKTPPVGTFALLVTTVVITLLIQRYFGAILTFIGKPFLKAKEAVYKRIAPRNPFSISLKTYKKHARRSSLARIENPVGPAMDIPLEKAYAPLKLVSKEAQDGVELFSYAASKQRFVVLGGPGTGKTTLMKSLIMSVIEKQCHKDLNDLIPIFVVLRKLASDTRTVQEAIVASFADYHFPGADRFVESALSQGKLLVVLDGLDEVGASREFVTKQIIDFCEVDQQRDAPNRLIVTCRENSYRTEDLRAVAPDVVRVEPFSNHHMRILLKGWPSDNKHSPLSLYQDIQADSQIRDICRNPLMLTILTGLYMETENFELPRSREKFYETAINELLEKRPARRSIIQKYPASMKKRVLERVSLKRLESIQNHEDPEELSKSLLIQYAKEEPVQAFDQNEFLKELVDINGIIKPANDNNFTVAHRTIQEFFAASEAERARRPDEAVHNFIDKPELTQVLYFYFSLITNIPQLNRILRTLLGRNKWFEAGICLLYTSEIPDEIIINEVSQKLSEGLKSSEDFKRNLELLSSLSQRNGQAFDNVRLLFSQAIEQLATGSGARDTSALESALSASPEAAMKIIPGLLNHELKEWQSVAIRLLRDIATDDSLDLLIKLLLSESAFIRSESALVLASMLESRSEDLKDRRSLLPNRVDLKIWPLERFFPGNIAIPIIEAIHLEKGDDIANKAISYAWLSRNYQATETVETQKIRNQWGKISTHLAIYKVKARLARGTIYSILCLGFIWSLFSFFLSIGAKLLDQVFIVDFQIPKIHSYKFDDTSITKRFGVFRQDSTLPEGLTEYDLSLIELIKTFTPRFTAFIFNERPWGIYFVVVFFLGSGCYVTRSFYSKPTSWSVPKRFFYVYIAVIVFGVSRLLQVHDGKLFSTIILSFILPIFGGLLLHLFTLIANVNWPRNTGISAISSLVDLALLDKQGVLKKYGIEFLTSDRPKKYDAKKHS